jgi:hypothetical protein
MLLAFFQGELGSHQLGIGYLDVPLFDGLNTNPEMQHSVNRNVANLAQ